MFENLLSIDFDVRRDGFDSGELEMEIEKIESSTPQKLFEEFYRGYAGKDLTEYQRSMIEGIFGEEQE